MRIFQPVFMVLIIALFILYICAVATETQETGKPSDSFTQESTVTQTDTPSETPTVPPTEISTVIFAETSTLKPAHSATETPTQESTTVPRTISQNIVQPTRSKNVNLSNYYHSNLGQKKSKDLSQPVSSTFSTFPSFQEGYIIKANVKIISQAIKTDKKSSIIALMRLPQPYDAMDIDKNSVTCAGASLVSSRVEGKGQQKIFIAEFNKQDLAGISGDTKVPVTITGNVTLRNTVHSFIGTDTVDIEPPKGIVNIGGEVNE